MHLLLSLASHSPLPAPVISALHALVQTLLVASSVERTRYASCTVLQNEWLLLLLHVLATRSSRQHSLGVVVTLAMGMLQASCSLALEGDHRPEAASNSAVVQCVIPFEYSRRVVATVCRSSCRECLLCVSELSNRCYMSVAVNHSFIHS
jgi:hypothetical protein